MLELQLEIQLEGQISLEMEIQNTEIIVQEGFDYFDIDWINPTLSDGTLTADFAFSPSPQKDVTKIELWINGSLAETRMSNDESAFVVENVTGSATIEIRAYNNDLLMAKSEVLTLPVPVAPDINEFSFQATKYVDITEYCSDPQDLPIELLSSGVPTNGLVSIIDNTTIAFQPIDDSQPTTVPYTIINSAGNTDSGTISVSWEEIVINITSPTEAQEFTDAEDITVAFEVTPAQQNYISAIALVVDDVEVEKRSPYSTADFVIDPLAEGAHSIKLRAYDLDDVLVEESDVRSFSVAAAANLLLDVYPNQFGESFALHKIRTSFTGDVIELKRDDGTAQRYAFDGDELPIATMSTFVGSGDGKVTWWKGQANGLEVSQTSDGACPLLFENGVLIEENGKPALKFSGAQFMEAPAAFGNGNNFYSVTVASIELVNGRGVVSEVNYSIDISKRVSFYYDTRTNKNHTVFVYDTGTVKVLANINQLNNAQLYIQSTVRSGIDLIGYTNSELQNTIQIGDSIGFDTLVIGKQTRSSVYHTGNISEVHFYNDNQVANRNGIEDFLNTKYNAYVV